MLSIVSGRLPRAKYRVLKNLRLGVIELDHVSNMDMLAVARLWLWAERPREEIEVLRMVSWSRQHRRQEARLEGLGWSSGFFKDREEDLRVRRMVSR
jgi:hypothetical protein